ncbi:heavy metal translocating P-type ATPase metal-binding domain-containing protein [Spirosoma telluris]|uniref:heavy metal translocating P-type ATPase metal-binding domain-containing protein n=1 Tax=Spirosoma telluris TaxID=2183553 RepID=UPI002FC3CE0F
MSTATISSTICYHCGNECPDESIVLDDKPFCCDGCKTVYSILSQHQLCQYYDIEQLSGKADLVSPVPVTV